MHSQHLYGHRTDPDRGLAMYLKTPSVIQKPAASQPNFAALAVVVDIDAYRHCGWSTVVQAP